jgi:bifunctional non-homologous end joining protein LigD
MAKRLPSANGATDLRFCRTSSKANRTKLVPVAFDLFYLNGQDLRRLPLTIGKAGLEKIITGPIFSSAEALPSAAARYLRMCRLGLEGDVSRVPSLYES